MKFEKTYLIDKWTDWNHMLSESIDNFHLFFSYYPNIIEANNHTYSQFDFLINEMPNEKQKVNRFNEMTNRIEKPNNNEYICISSFKSLKASVEFAIDHKLNDKEFRLVYDSEPDWGDDEIFVNTPVEKLLKVII